MAPPQDCEQNWSCEQDNGDAKCVPITLKKITPEIIRKAQKDKEYLVELELNQPTRNNTLTFDILLPENIKNEDITINPQKLVFEKNTKKASFTFKHKLDTDFEITVANPKIPSNKLKLIVLKGDCKGKEKRCIGYFIQTCKDNTWGVLEQCKDDNHVCEDPSFFGEKGPVRCKYLHPKKILSPTSIFPIGTNIGMTFILNSYSDRKKEFAILSTTGNLKPLSEEYDLLTGDRQIDIFVHSDPDAQPTEGTISVGVNFAVKFNKNYSLVKCKKDQTTCVESQIATCNENGSWNTAQNCPSYGDLITTCNLFHNNCENLEILRAKPEFSEIDKEPVKITILLNGYYNGENDLIINLSTDTLSGNNKMHIPKTVTVKPGNNASEPFNVSLPQTATLNDIYTLTATLQGESKTIATFVKKRPQ